MHLVFKLKPAKHLTSVLLEVAKLVDDLRFFATLSANLIKLVIEAQVLQAGKKL